MSENIFWQNNKVTYEDRCNNLGQKGKVVWFTGLSGSGKSTIATEVEALLYQNKNAVYLLDGDNIRTGINSDLGFSKEDRDENIRRISEIAALFKDAGLIVLVACISPFADMRRFARKRAGENDFIEIYVSTDFETCTKRDPKGLYKKNISNFTGKTSPYEIPQNPQIILDTVKYNVHQCADIVYKKILSDIKC